MSELPQEFDTFLLQASNFSSILEFFYECGTPLRSFISVAFSMKTNLFEKCSTDDRLKKMYHDYLKEFEDLGHNICH